jgi:hypothetical protein
MFIKITKNQRGESYYHLVESYRQEGKVKQRTLLSLGKVGEDKLEQGYWPEDTSQNFITYLKSVVTQNYF